MRESIQPLRFETERKNRDRRGKEHRDGRRIPWNVYFAFRDFSNGAIPVELNSLGGRWSFNGGDINLAHDIISSSLSMTRENLSPMKFSLPIFLLTVSYFFLFFFREQAITTFPYIFIYDERKRKINKPLDLKKKKKCIPSVSLVIDRFLEKSS